MILNLYTTESTAIDLANLRQGWLELIWRIAQGVNNSGRQRRLVDMTITLPADYAAVNAVLVACRLLKNDSQLQTQDLDQLLQSIESDQSMCARFTVALQNLEKRVMPKQ
jgi:hypothetical protein